jgi:hypothetical protein
MAMESPASTCDARRERSAKSHRRVSSKDDISHESHTPNGGQEERVNRRVARGSSPRGLQRGASSRGLARSSSRRLIVDNKDNATSNATSNDNDNDEEQEEADSNDASNNNNNNNNNRKRSPRRRVIHRTASMQQKGNEAPRRRSLMRNKSCDGSTMPFQRVQRHSVLSHARMERTASVRRMSSRNLSSMEGTRSRTARSPSLLVNNVLDRSKSERRFVAAATDDTVMRVPGRTMDGSSSNNNNNNKMMGRSARRGGRRDDSHSPHHSGLTKTASGRNDVVHHHGSSIMNNNSSSMNNNSSSQGGGGVRRRRRPTRVMNGERADLKQELDNDSDDDTVEGHVVTRGKGLDDSHRRRKEPTLSKMSIDQLRDRLIKKEPEKEEQEQEEQENDWAEFPPPLTADLND